MEIIISFSTYFSFYSLLYSENYTQSIYFHYTLSIYSNYEIHVVHIVVNLSNYARE